MFDYDKLTTEEKILFQRVKSELYQESFFSDNPDMQKINACFSVLERLGYMDSLPEPMLYENLCKIQEKCRLEDEAPANAPKQKRRGMKRSARVALAVAALLAVLCAVAYAASTVRIDVWSLIGDKDQYIYNEDIETLYDPQAGSLSMNDEFFVEWCAFHREGR